MGAALAARQLGHWNGCSEQWDEWLDSEEWQDAAPLALALWQQAANDTRVSGGFRDIAAANAVQLQKLIARV